MLDLIRIAFLNVFRNLRRTVLTLSSMIVGYSALACFGGFIEFSFEGLRENLIRSQLGHIQIYEKGYGAGHSTEPEKYLLSAPDAIEALIAPMEGVENVAQMLSFSGLASSGTHSVSVSVIGVDPRKNDSFADFETLVEGRQLRRLDTATGVVGTELKKGLGVELGTWVTVLASSVDGIINTADFQLVGSVRTGSLAYDEVFTKVPLRLARRLRDTEKAEKILVLLEDTESVPHIRSLIAQILEREGHHVEMTIWSDAASFYHSVRTLYSGLFHVFAVIVGIVVMFAVANTMTMSVFERTREVGALRALGSSRARIVLMFIFEGIFIGVLGVLLGALGTWGVTELLEAAGGIPIPPPPGMSRGYQANFLLTWRVMFIAAGVTLSAAFVSSIYPAVRAARFNIVRALDHA